MRYCSTFQTMSGSCSTLPYIGSKISLISNSDIRYEGILYTINTQESTVALQDVRSYGTEGRKFPDIPGSSEVFDFIIFRGKDIKDLTVCEPAKIHDDPAIVSMNIPPSRNIGDGMNSLPLSGGVNNNQIGTGCGINTNIGVTGSQIPPIGRVDRVYSNCQGIGYQRGTGGSAGRFGGGSASNCSGISSSYGRSSMMNGHVSHGRGGGGRSGGYGGGYGHNRGSRHVVGELVAQPNQSVKSEVACDFDFDEANAKFEKAGCIRSGKGLEVGGNGCGLGSGGLSDGNIGAGGGNLRNAESVVGSLGIIGGYDKKTSFFDNISCETLDRQHGRDEKINREKQRALDAETFGVIATQYRSFRSSYRRSGGPGRSGGGNDVGSSSIGGMGSLSIGGPGGSGIGNSSGASAARNFRGYGYSRGIGGGYGSKGIGYNSQYGSGASTNLGIGYAQHRYPAY